MGGACIDMADDFHHTSRMSRRRALKMTAAFMLAGAGAGVGAGFGAGGGVAVAGKGERLVHIVAFRELAGWEQADNARALEAFQRSCRAMLQHDYHWRKARFGGQPKDWMKVCELAISTPRNAKAARAFFEKHFLPVTPVKPLKPAGLFTGYYEPEVAGSQKRGGPYQVPLHGKPDDLVAFTPAEQKKTGLRYGRRVKGQPRPYYTRRQIETGALKGRGLELVWLKSHADRFFMQVQGSGRVRLPDGKIVRMSFAGKTGLPFTPIGRLLIERGEIPREKMSMQAIRQWMKKNPDKARKLMWENKSYVFFRKVRLDDPRLGAIGAQGVQLTPLVSLAVDYRYWPYGAPVWLQTRVPGPGGKGQQRMRRLMVAQDTGTAIRGMIRGDIFFGFGDEAGKRAGKMKAPGIMVVLLPRALALRLAGYKPRRQAQAGVARNKATDRRASGNKRASGKRQNWK
jgi:membrane-bound lytic murein transglycosylase A